MIEINRRHDRGHAIDHATNHRGLRAGNYSRHGRNNDSDHNRRANDGRDRRRSSNR